MNTVTGLHNNDFQILMVSNTGEIVSGVEQKDLPEQAFGFYRADVFNGQPQKSMLTPTFSQAKRIDLMYGKKRFKGQLSPQFTRQDRKPKHGVTLTSDNIIRWEGFKSKGDIFKNIQGGQVALGYNGIDASSSLEAMYDAKNYYVNLVLSGPNIQKYFGKNSIVHKLIIDKDFCQAACGDCLDECKKVPCTMLADKIVERVYADELIQIASGVHGQLLKYKLSDFIDAHVIKKCIGGTAAVAPTLVEFTKYTLSVCGNDKIVKDGLSTQFPGLAIETKVNGTNTEYTITLPKADPAPAALTLTSYALPICDTCPTCPDTFTKIPKSKRVSAKVACGAAAPVVAGALSTIKVGSSRIAGDTYLIAVPLTTTDEAIMAGLTACTDITILGVTEAGCVGTDVEVDWIACPVETKRYKLKKKFMIVLPDEQCGLTDHLPGLVAAYPDLTITSYTPAVTGQCISAYQTEIESEYLDEQECGRVDLAKFNKPGNYKTFAWVEYQDMLDTPVCTPAASVPEPCCACGVIFTVKVFDESIEENCRFEGYESFDISDILPTYLHVDVYQEDFTLPACNKNKTFVTVLRETKFNVGESGSRVREMEKSALSYENQMYNLNPYEAEQFGGEIFAQHKYVYDCYRLTVGGNKFDGEGIGANNRNIDYVFYIRAGAGKAFEATMNTLVLSSNNPNLTPVVL